MRNLVGLNKEEYGFPQYIFEIKTYFVSMFQNVEIVKKKLEKRLLQAGFFLALLLPFSTFSQKVHLVKFANQADVKIFEVAFENQADLKVFKVEFPNQAEDCSGLWFETDFENQAQWKIFKVDFENQADLKVFYVKFRNQAGWRDEGVKERFCGR
jgi:hypothetical protein